MRARWAWQGEERGAGGMRSEEGNIYDDADKPFHLRQAHKISKVIASKSNCNYPQRWKSISAWEYFV